MGRPSHVRPAIEEILDGDEHHAWTISDMGAALAELGVSADPSSVFRGLVRLDEEGKATRVDLGDGKLRFEATGAHHEHIECEECGRIAAIPGCLVEELVPHVESETGFAVRDHRIVFSGVCRGCASEAA
jgi:Fur family ferric uptake transcriptional regulator